MKESYIFVSGKITVTVIFENCLCEKWYITVNSTVASVASQGLQLKGFTALRFFTSSYCNRRAM